MGNFQQLVLWACLVHLAVDITIFLRAPKSGDEAVEFVLRLQLGWTWILFLLTGAALAIGY